MREKEVGADGGGRFRAVGVGQENSAYKIVRTVEAKRRVQVEVRTKCR